MPPDSSSSERIPCLVCGGTELRLRFVQRSYPVYRCGSCGLEFVAPIPSTAELAEYYDRSYSVPLEMYAAATARNVARIADLERFCPERGHLLELGASYGHGLALARDRGWKVTGVELSPTASEHARTHFGLTVYTRDIGEVPLPDGSFDAIVMWHVLEHVRNPKDQLMRLGALLKPGGVLGLRVPNIASFGARVAAQWWPWMCPPAHLWFFSSTTLPTLLDACGYDVLEVKTRRGDGNNVYQYALMATGNALNGLRTLLRPGRRENSLPAGAGTAPAGAAPSAPTPKANAPLPSVPMGAPSGLMQKWLEVLERAQPVTNALNRATRPIIEPIESRGWGDELLVYARRRR